MVNGGGLRCITIMGGEEPFYRDTYIQQLIDGGYSSHIHHLAYGLSQMVLMTKAPGFLPCLTPEALWRELTKPAFTTPLKREWMPVLLKQATEGRGHGIKQATAWGCQPGIVTFNSTTLDQFICERVKHGTFRL